MIASSKAVAVNLMRQTSGKAGGHLDDIHLKSQRKFYEAIKEAISQSEGTSRCGSTRKAGSPKHKTKNLFHRKITFQLDRSSPINSNCSMTGL